MHWIEDEFGRRKERLHIAEGEAVVGLPALVAVVLVESLHPRHRVRARRRERAVAGTCAWRRRARRHKAQPLVVLEIGAPNGASRQRRIPAAQPCDVVICAHGVERERARARKGVGGRGVHYVLDSVSFDDLLGHARTVV